MSLTSLIAALSLAASPTPDAATLVTLPQPAPASTAQDPTTPVQLEDIQVTGRRLTDLIDDFVNQIAEPNAHRTLAKYDASLCVGVANLQTEAAQYIADRISTVAEDLGVRTSQPGCRPNLLIVASSDGSGTARALVQGRRSAFRVGGSGMDRGMNALRDFVETDRPIRWWQVSVPIDSETGQVAVALPGQCRGDCTSPEDMAPVISVSAASRLRTQIVDRIIRTIVVVDVDQVSHLGINQIADYIAMVSLAQINPDADTSAYSSILNVFSAPQDTDRLTTWDQAYLAGLYEAEQDRQSALANRSEIARSISRQHARLVEAQPTPE